ncbi:hypothetical protein [Tamilnaduibacter salinus]|nr:hypothetical protein [Tamilnaduibacter salinus]
MEKVSSAKAQFVRDHSREETVYFESNHCFIKGFGWFMPRHLPEDELGVIILKRDPNAIAKSYWRVGCSPLRSFGRNWLITPDATQSIVPPPSKGGLPPKLTYWFAKLTKDLFSLLRSITKHVSGSPLQDPAWVTQYELEALRWYVDETHAKASQFRERFPRASYYEITIDDLNSLTEIHKMLRHFGLSANDGLSDIVGKPTNLKTI